MPNCVSAREPWSSTSAPILDAIPKSSFSRLRIRATSAGWPPRPPIWSGRTATKGKRLPCCTPAARGLYRLTLDQDLKPGEYALVEKTSEGDVDLYVWDFGVDAVDPRVNRGPFSATFRSNEGDSRKRQPYGRLEVAAWITLRASAEPSKHTSASASNATSSEMRKALQRARARKFGWKVHQLPDMNTKNGLAPACAASPS